MKRILLAIRILFRVLFDADLAEQVRQLLGGRPSSPETAGPLKAKQKNDRPPSLSRNDALTLLATLQREARLVDFVKEPLNDFNDAQIGAVVRDIHRDCGTVLERVFALRPLLSAEENADVEVPPGFDAGRYQLTGNLAGEPPFHGRLVHQGWEATKCEIASWTGNPKAERVVAPAEVELE